MPPWIPTGGLEPAEKPRQRRILGLTHGTGNAAVHAISPKRRENFKVELNQERDGTGTDWRADERLGVWVWQGLGKTRRGRD